MSIDRQTVATVEEDLSPPLEVGDNLRPLRERLASLMDEASLRVQLAGLEPDDCVLERHGRFRFIGEHDDIQAPIEGLTDRAVFLKPFLAKHLDRFGTSDHTRAIEVTALTIHALRVPDFPPSGPTLG